MGAAVDFYAGLGGEASGVDLSGSGIGFYGASFGASVQVGQYQDTSFITNSNGSVQGPQVDNNKYQGNASGVSNNGGGVIHISGLPLESGTVNIRFTNGSAVNTQNGEVRIFDRTDINAGASGVTSQVAQLVQGGSGVEPTTGAAQAWDSGEDGWLALAGSGTVSVLLNNPGSGGTVGSGASQEDTRHDWYFALSASPDTIGSKTLFGLYVQLEFL
jgi:hypothetical protein